MAEQYSERIVQKTGIRPDEATEIATEPVTNTEGGMVIGTVVASELPSIQPGQEYILFSPVPVPKEDTLICNYEPDVTGFIFFTSSGYGSAAKPTYVPQGDPRVPDLFKSGARKIIVANAELRKAGMGDHLFLRQAKKPEPAASPP